MSNEYDHLNANLFPDDSAVLIIRQGRILYAYGTDVNFSDETSTERTMIRLDALNRVVKRNIQVQILEKDPEDVRV